MREGRRGRVKQISRQAFRLAVKQTREMIKGRRREERRYEAVRERGRAKRARAWEGRSKERREIEREGSRKEGLRRLVSCDSKQDKMRQPIRERIASGD